MITIQAKHFDLRQIVNSGQCFRMEEVSKDLFRVFHYRKEVMIRQESSVDILHFFCTEEDFDSIWCNYFDLYTDYLELDSKIDESDSLLVKGKKYGSGIRILNQDFWEMCVSFVISQNNNIPRIKKCINGLCEKNEGLFPDPYDLQIMNLSDLGLGYRDTYLKDLAKEVINENIFEPELRAMSYLDAKEKLMSVRGIGEKVANCICLFGLHKMEACPIDVWMKRVISEDYAGVYPEWVNDENAGYYQQLAFYYKRGGWKEDTGGVLC